MQHKVFLYILTILVSIFIFLIPFKIVSPIFLIPKNINYYGYTNSDSIHGGDSASEIISKSDDLLEFKYILKDKYKYPYAGFTFDFKDNPLSLGSRNMLRYKISSSKFEKMRINISISHNVKEVDNFIYEKYIDVSLNPGAKTINLNSIKVAHWWYSSYQLDEGIFPPPPFKNISFISLASSGDIPRNIEDNISVKELVFYIDSKPYIILACIIFIIGTHLFLVRIIFLRKNKKSPVIYEQTEIKEEQDIEGDLVVKYLGANYSSSQLNVELISKETEVPRYMIPKVINSRFGQSLPKYLNRIRICEAKRYLKESEFSVLNISLNVGYNTVNHFNRTFKLSEGISPLEYRKKYKL